jgi:hypothetical protein
MWTPHAQLAEVHSWALARMARRAVELVQQAQALGGNAVLEGTSSAIRDLQVRGCKSAWLLAVPVDTQL